MKKHRAGGKRKSFADIRRRYANGIALVDGDTAGAVQARLNQLGVQP